jgi:hypothetical protein
MAMTYIKSFTVNEAISIVGAGYYPALPGVNVDRVKWSQFVESNVDYAFIDAAVTLFQQIDENLNGLEDLCKWIANGAEPNRLVMKGIISCRIAPSVADGLIADNGRLSLGVAWDNGWKLILNTQGVDLALTWGHGKNFSKELSKESFDRAEAVLINWGMVIVGKPVEFAGIH